MSSAVRKRILLAVDGSEQSFEAVRYVSRAMPPERVEVVLLHIVTKVPESFWDLEKEPAYHYRIVNIGAWEEQHDKMIQEYMEQARQLLLSAGIPEDAVTVKIQERKAGIARDIVSECDHDYDAVVVGRRGLSELKDFVLGNIATKLVEKLAHIPVWVVGGKPVPGKMLICADSSEGARRAVDYVGKTLDGNSRFEVTLFHVIRGLNVFKQMFGKSFSFDVEKDWTEKAEKELAGAREAMEPVLEDLKARLVEAGLDADRVNCKIVTGASSRAAAIVEEAERKGCDTIVVGRRGLSMIQEFFMGRVSSKVIHLAREMAVWVVC